MKNSKAKIAREFQEIGHCGGQFTIEVKTNERGQRGIQYGIRHSRPTSAAWFAIYALPTGNPVGTIQLGGIGQRWNPPPTTDSMPIFIASDSLGMFGHQCHRCKGYWRSKSSPSRWYTTCPYCGLHAETHYFLTEGQAQYVKACCERIAQAMDSAEDGNHTIDMDEVVDAVEQGVARPPFYYAEESQQNEYTCRACSDINDILGRYGYCSCCGTHNGFDELVKDITAIRDRISDAQDYESLAKDIVSAFDSYARQIAKQLARRIPMTSARRTEWSKKLFHNLRPCADALETVFDIKMFKGLKDSDIAFGILMFHRRHVYEHNGGEVDEKYIRDSGDTTVRVKQSIRETSESASKIADIVLQMGKNIHEGFHEIFPPEKLPVSMRLSSL